MLTMTLDHMLDSTIDGEQIVIHYNDNNGESIFYNPDTVPGSLLDMPVSYIETLPQYDGTTALCFTVYE